MGASTWMSSRVDATRAITESRPLNACARLSQRTLITHHRFFDSFFILSFSSLLSSFSTSPSHSAYTAHRRTLASLSLCSRLFLASPLPTTLPWQTTLLLCSLSTATPPPHFLLSPFRFTTHIPSPQWVSHYPRPLQRSLATKRCAS